MQYRKALSAISAGVVVAALTSLVSTAPAHATGGTTIIVDPSTQYQTVQGWGTSLAWWAEAAGGWSRSNLTTLDNAVFGLTPGGAGLGMNIVRYQVGAATPGDQCASTMRVGAAVPSFDSVSDTSSTGGLPATSYDWTRDPTQVQVLQDAQNDGANVFAATAYSAPASMTLDNCGGSSSDGSDNLASGNYQNYADYLAKVVEHFHDTLGIPFSTVDAFNEPVQSGWTNANCVAAPAYPRTKCQQGMVLGSAAQRAILGDLHNDLASDNDNYSHLSAPDELTVGGSISDYNAYTPALQADLTQVNSHNYGDGWGNTEDGSPLYNFGQSTNKNTWMSEWGSDAATQYGVETNPSTAAGSSAMDLSQEILKNEDEMHPSGWIAWQAADGPFSGQSSAQNLMNGGGDVNDLWGLAGIDYSAGSNQTVTFPLRYYAMGNYSEFVRPGYRMIQNSDANTFAAWDAGSNTLVLVTTNPAASAATNTYDLSGFTLNGSTVTAYQTAPAQNGQAEEHLAAVTPAPSLAGSTFTATVPAQSITTYVVSGASYTGTGASAEIDDATTGTGLNQWNYHGSGWQQCSGSGCATPQSLYQQTTSWDGTANDTATSTFTGSRVRLFGVTDTNEGRANISVDGGPPTEVDFYSHQRHGDQLMWESPALSAGSHTVSITVTGGKNPQSNGDLIALDRAEVDPALVSVDDAAVGSGLNQWQYGGAAWQHCSSAQCSDPQHMYAGTTTWDATMGDTATLRFSGSTVQLYGVVDSTEGIANLSVDGGSPTQVDFYSATRKGNQLVYQQSGLSPGNHTLTLTVTHTKNANSSNYWPAIDRAVVTAPVTSVDDAVQGTGHDQWNYAGAWSHCSSNVCGDPQDMYAGTNSWDATAGDTATLTFDALTGATIGLYGVTDANEGQANVAVDGGTSTLTDFYSAQRHGDQLLWTSPVLAAGTHTLTVTVTHTKNANSSNYWPAIDKAEIDTPAPTSFISALTTGTSRNNFTGNVGMEFTTGSTGLQVTAVGREHLQGDSNAHAVTIYRVSDGVLIASASVSTASTAIDTQGFQYAALTQPVTLTANTSYYLVSAETSGGDPWYDANTQVALSSGGTAFPAYQSSGTWTTYPPDAGQTYGPVSLRTG